MKRWSSVLATTAGALAAVAMALPAHAADIEADPGTVGVSVQITPLECATGCVPGAEGVGALAASGLPPAEPVVWAATLLLAAGAALVLRAASRRIETAPASDSGDGACQS